MVEFIRKESYRDDNPFIGCDRVTPVWFRKDGVEYFVINEMSDDGPIEKNKRESIIKEIEFTDGMLATFHGSGYMLFDYLAIVAELKFTLRRSYGSKPFVERFDYMNCWDFSCNLNEYSLGCHFRIYDEELSEAVSETVDLIEDGKYEEALRFIHNLPKNLAKFTTLKGRAKIT